LRTADIPDTFDLKERFYAGKDWINIGNSAIVDPNGEFIAGPMVEAEGLLYAEIDPRLLAGSKWMLDVAGHYARPDVFTLTLHDGSHPMLVRDGASGETAAEPAT
jgi:nitrilase